MQLSNTFLPLCLLVLLVAACDDTRQRDSVTTVKKEKEPQMKKERHVVLTKDNAVRELTAYGEANLETTAIISTSMGDIKVRLYENTPLHRANFVRLAKNDFFDNTQFYRVIKDFVVQGGDSDDLAQRGKKRKMGKYQVPAEITPENLHKRGALAAARRYENNPEKMSTPWDFYIVQGPAYSEMELDAIARENKLQLNSRQREVYTTIGGNPNLDGEHTVFGEVLEGMEVVNKIAGVEVGEGDWPVEKVYIKNVKILK